MKRLVIVSVLLSIAAGLCAGPCLASEMRGLWVDAFHPGIRTPEQTSAMVAEAEESGFSALFVQVRRRGDVLYRSAVEPMDSRVAAGYDPLADVVEKAHKAGLQVHAWISVFEVYHDTKWNTSDPEQVHVKHPEWLMKDDRMRTRFASDRMYLDPGLPEVRAYLARIVAEIAKNYNVDGIHLDVVRYPDQAAGYNEASLAGFSRETKKQGKPATSDKDWSDWRRSRVTDFVRLAREAAKSGKKQIALSATVGANTIDCLYNGFQDWPGWLKDGLLDFAVPMVFSLDDRVYEKQVTDLMSACKGKTIYIGQAGWRLKASKSIGRINFARNAGAGVVVYSYDGCNKAHKGDKSSLMNALAKVFAE